MALFVPPLLGATVVFEHSANPAEIIRTIKRERATALIAVPRMLDGLARGNRARIRSARQDNGLRRTSPNRPNGQKFLRRAWRFRRIHRRFGWKFWAFISGGAALSARDRRIFQARRLRGCARLRHDRNRFPHQPESSFSRHAGLDRQILPGREFRLAEDGEILVRGENVSSRLLGKAGGVQQGVATKAWLRTGDIGELDAEGNLRFQAAARKTSSSRRPA